MKEGAHLDAALAMLKEHFANREFLWMLMPELEESRSDKIDPFLDFVIEHTPDKYNRAEACFSLAMRVKGRAEHAGSTEQADLKHIIYG